MKCLFFAILVLLSGICNGQSKKFDFKLGTEYELPRKTSDLAFIGNDKDGIINLSLKKDELTILRFDYKNLGQTAEKIIELPEATKNFNSEQVIDFGTNYYWIHSDWDKGSGTEMLYYDKIDVLKGRLSETNKKLFQTTKIAAGGFASRGWYSGKAIDKYEFSRDADNTKLLVSYRLFPEERNDKINYDILGFQVFDDNMKKLWGGEFRMPYTEAVMDNSDFTVDYNGNAYFLAKVYDSEKRREYDKETGLPGYHYEVFKFTKDSKKPIKAVIVAEGKFIKQPSIIENAQHEIIIACTYSKKAKGGTDGVFLASFNPEGKIVSYKKGFYEFPVDELMKFENAKARRKMEKQDDYEASNLLIHNVVVDNDGGVFIACEEFYYVVNTYTSANGSTRTSTTYYYEDIIAAKVNVSGNFEWVRKIPKRQKGLQGRGTMSFKLVADQSGYYLLYLDNLKNMELAEDEEPKYHVDGFGGQVVVSKVDMQGNLSKELVFNTREEEVQLFPVNFDKINDNQFIGRATLKRGLYKPLLITVK